MPRLVAMPRLLALSVIVSAFALWYLHRVYDELDGPLGDDIAAIPRS